MIDPGLAVSEDIWQLMMCQDCGDCGVERAREIDLHVHRFRGRLSLPTRDPQSGIRTTKRDVAAGVRHPDPMIHIRPMGASVHYAGTIPMAPAGTKWSTDEAKNLAFTLMANAVRIADAIF